MICIYKLLIFEIIININVMKFVELDGMLLGINKFLFYFVNII